jgi:hypothetical protein
MPAAAALRLFVGCCREWGRRCIFYDRLAVMKATGQNNAANSSRNDHNADTHNFPH